MNVLLNTMVSAAPAPRLWGCSIACVWVLTGYVSVAADEAEFSFELSANRVVVGLGDVSIGNYVFKDDTIPRPYWTDVHAPGGERITRVHPPSEPDYADHAAMHPGIWMAFGDLNGSDFWRNKARIRHLRFVTEPTIRAESFFFSVENVYESLEGNLICHEIAKFTFQTTAYGYILDWASQFFPVERDIVFGDQEEMGLGFRVAKRLSVRPGQGEIRSDRGGRNEAGVWGKTARWCDYSAVIGDQRRGITVIPHPQNFRASWMHARDYGFLAANPFGRNAMAGGAVSAVRVEPGSALGLRFGLHIYAVPVAEAGFFETVYERYAAQDP